MERVLQSIGLSKNESKIYLAALHAGRMSVADMSRATGVHRRNVYDALERLLEKGLLFRILSQNENVYEPAPPAKCLEIVREKEASFLDILPDLEKSYHSEASKDEVYILKGIEGFKQCFRQMLQKNETVHILGGHGFWFDERLKPYTMQFMKEARKAKMRIECLFDRNVLANKKDVPRNFTHYRFLPASIQNNVTIDIAGDMVVTFTGQTTANLGRDITLFVNINSELAEGYLSYFHYLWDKSLEKKL